MEFRQLFAIAIAFVLYVTFLFYSNLLPRKEVRTIRNVRKFEEAQLLNTEHNESLHIDESAKWKDNVSPRQERNCRGFSVVFAKTHKTGSSMLFDVLKKALRKKTGDALERFPFPFVGGYPGYFQKRFAHSILCASSQGDVETAPPSYLLAHMRFDKKEIQALTGNNTRYFTIMRNPFKQLESSFNFYYGRYKDRVQKLNVTCHTQPYHQIVKKLGVSYRDYLKAIDKSTLNTSIAWYFRSRNPQSYDLGLDATREDRSYLLESARDLDSSFDLVLLLEYLPESLVLLKEKLCLKWKEVTVGFVLAGSYAKHVYTEQEKAKIRSINKLDFMLYDYFNKSLWRKVEQYGRARMEKDTEYLRQLTKAKSKSRIRSKLPVLTFVRNRRSMKYEERNEESISRLMDSLSKECPNGDKNVIREMAVYMLNNSGWCPS